MNYKSAIYVIIIYLIHGWIPFESNLIMVAKIFQPNTLSLLKKRIGRTIR